MIQADHLIKKYGSLTALDLPVLTIPAGESFGLVGNNGAGKTTFFRLVLNLIKATEGKVLSNGLDVAQTEDWKKYTGSFLDESFLIGFLTPEEYFDFIARVTNLSDAALKDQLFRFEGLFNGEILGKKKYIRDFSRGNQKKIGIVAALLADPRVVVLDEPFANLDPTTVSRLKKILLEIQAERKVTFLISSHDLKHVTDVCERIVILDHGKVTRDLRTGEDTLKEVEQFFAAE
jgi:ABC-2 type transport system ATP-binding protein